MNYALSEEEVAQYRRDGFVVVEQLYNADDLTKVYATTREITEHAAAGSDFSKILEIEPEANGSMVPRRIFNPYDQHENFRAIAHDPRLLGKIESLVGANFNLQHSKLI